MNIEKILSIFTDKKQESNFLHTIFLTGIILFAAAALALIILFFVNRSHTKKDRQLDSFHRILREYDISASVFTGTQREIEILSHELDRMEKKAIGFESWLSILKRRRTLALSFPSALSSYHDSILRARKIFPSSEAIAAIAASALVKDSALTSEKENELRELLFLLTDSSYNSLRLNLHILLGDFRTPERAAQIPYSLYSDGMEIIDQNLIILKIIDRDIRLASAAIQPIISASPSPDFIRFAAEFYYDFGELQRAAELFSWLEDDNALIRQADALYLAGFQNSARALWTILSQGHIPFERALYNLSVTSQDAQEALSFLQKLVDSDPANEDIRQFALIRYSRLLSIEGALAILQNDDFLKPTSFPFLDLEICKRRSLLQEPRRRLAEAWLLMDRHYDSEELFWWSAWVMSYNKFYGELEILLRRLAHNNFTDYADLYNAVFLMTKGDIDTAETLLRSIPGENPNWVVHANLGRILEERFSHARALEEYEIAVMLTRNPTAASGIYLRMARCFSVLNRPIDAVMALENALLFDPENLAARLELNRFFR